MRNFYISVVLLIISIFDCTAQVDTEFWFAPPEVTSGHGDQPIYLRISALDQTASVRVIQPARGNVELANIVIAANTTQTLNLTTQISNLETSVPATVMKTGIKVISSVPIAVYYEVGASNNAEIFVLKGKNALGNRFMIPGQNLYDNFSTYYPTPYSSFDIVATANNTVVKIRPKKPVFGHEADSVITVKLNAGETYSFRKTTTSASNNLTGTVVESNKPIAITLKDDSVINASCRDLLGDQLVPINVVGKEYIVLKGFLENNEYFFITATEDGTQIYIGGSTSPVATLKAGEVYRHLISLQSTYVLSSKPIYMLHVTGFGCEVGMAILPSINCKGSQQIGFSRTTNEFFGLNIMVRKEGINSFKVNGSFGLIPESAFVAVPGTNNYWYTAQLSYSSTQIPVGQGTLISNDQYSFQLGIINGNARSTCRYGYFTAFSTLFIGDDFDICEGETATLDAGPGKQSYLWNTGATTQKIQITKKGSYWVKAVKDECILSDTITVDVKKGKVDLGPDIEACAGDTITIDGKENFSWLWSDGSRGRYLKTTKIGKYWVSVFDYTGCTASDTIIVTPFNRLFGQEVKIKLNYVSVDTADERNINVGWSVTHSERVKVNSIFLYKRISGSEKWQVVSQVSANISQFTDKENLTDEEVYEYYAGLANRCRKEELLSTIHNSILLTGTADPINERINLRWNNYLNWENGVRAYELWRKLDESPNYELLTTIQGNVNSFSAPIASDGFNHSYVIRALEASDGGESWSNNVGFEFEHPVYIPNVFTPNGDAYNQHFEIPKIELYRDCDLIVVNRWGRKIFEAKGYKNDWDGNGMADGVYYYLLDLKRGNRILKGTVSILR